jgi:hypothetical protein
MPRTLVVTVNIEVVVPDDDFTSESLIAESVGLGIAAQEPAIVASMFYDNNPAGCAFGEISAKPDHWKD